MQYELCQYFKSRATTLQFKIKDVKDDFEVVIDIINKSDSNVFNIDNDGISITSDDYESSYLSLNEEELEACRNVHRGGRGKTNLDTIGKMKNGEIHFWNDNGYTIIYVPNDNRKTLKKLKNDVKNSYADGFNVIKLDKHFYQVWR